MSTRQHLVPGLLDLSDDEITRETKKIDRTWLLMALIGVVAAALVFYATTG